MYVAINHAKQRIARINTLAKPSTNLFWPHIFPKFSVMDDSFGSQSFREPRLRKDSDVAEDHNIQSTNDDASECKASAVHLGYWNDPYVKYFIKKIERKAPEIHRGYYARVTCIRTLVERFLSIAGPEAQIVNLGAGFDTLYWHLVDTGVKFANFVEVDFSTVTAKKIHHITKPHCPLLQSISVSEDEIRQSAHRDLHGPRYHLIGADVRDVNEMEKRLEETKLNRSAPTLFLAECVLIYMASDQSCKLISFLADIFPTSCFINYELVNLDDKFGDVFKENMSTRGLTLAGVNICKSLSSQTERFVNGKWSLVRTYNMNDVYEKYIPKTDRDRIEKLEFLDEKELLTQLLQHYCVVVAVNDSKNVGLRKIFFE